MSGYGMPPAQAGTGPGYTSYPASESSPYAPHPSPQHGGPPAYAAQPSPYALQPGSNAQPRTPQGASPRPPAPAAAAQTPTEPPNALTDPIVRLQGLILKDLRNSLLFLVTALHRLATLSAEEKGEVGVKGEAPGSVDANPASNNPASNNPASVNPASVAPPEGEETRKASPRKSAVTAVQRHVESFEAICDQIEANFLVIAECCRTTKLKLDKTLPLPVRPDAEARAPGPPALSHSQAAELSEAQIRYAHTLRELFNDTLAQLHAQTKGRTDMPPIAVLPHRQTSMDTF